jgi:hypothetical protein
VKDYIEEFLASVISTLAAKYRFLALFCFLIELIRICYGENMAPLIAILPPHSVLSSIWSLRS